MVGEFRVESLGGRRDASRRDVGGSCCASRWTRMWEQAVIRWADSRAAGAGWKAYAGWKQGRYRRRREGAGAGAGADGGR